MLLDTHTLLWWTFDSKKLSVSALEACESFSKDNPAVISAISIWEIGIKVNKKKLEIGIDFKEYADRLKRLNFIEIIPVDIDILIENIYLEWDHRDPADRTIVATAKIKQLPIITKDHIIQSFYEKTIW